MKGVGPSRSEALAKDGVHTIEDLLWRLPFRYEDRSRFVPIRSLKPGERALVSGRVTVCGLRRARRLSLFEARIEDESGRVKALWFNQPYLKDSIDRGTRIVLYGPVERDPRGVGLMFSSPEFEVLDDDEASAAVHVGRIVPIYERFAGFSGRQMRRWIAGVVEALPKELPETLPVAARERLGVVSRGEAFRAVHRPADDAPLADLNRFRAPGHLRLILEELFLFQLGLARRRAAVKDSPKGIAFTITDATRDAVKAILPFHLTAAQRRVVAEIAADMRSSHPMHRLVQGDVGSGKTIVALLAMVVAVENGYQAAFMAPTEILAEQHWLTFKRLLQRRPYAAEALTGGMTKKERSAALGRIASGESKIVVGTHALIQEGVAFHRLGLAVVDEQHRFGVLQREDLTRKGYDVDVLIMTATPIPRTLSLTAYGDLDVSVLDEKPPGRTPILTTHHAASDRARIVQAVRDELAAGRRAYVVYPLVDESEKLEDVNAATVMAEEWRRLLPSHSVALLHGKLKSADKEAVMADFSAGRAQVLVATSVIEVGVDVPQATLMVVEHAERFGLAQLHQLRGRVGRAALRSRCLLVTHGRLSDVARKRIDTLVGSNDGFAIAEADLLIRGPGDFFGTRQWGMPDFRASHLLRDRDLLERARTEAVSLYPEIATGKGEWARLKKFLDAGGWAERFGLATVG